MNRPPRFGSLAFQSLCWIALSLAYHGALQAWMFASGERLGWITAERVAPLQASWSSRLPGPWALPALVVLGLLFAFRGRLFRDKRLAPDAFVLAATGLFLCVALSLAMLDGFVERDGERMAAFLVQHSKPNLESYGDVPRLHRLGLRRFCALYSDPKLLPKLATHTRSHPPGPVLFQWVVLHLLGKRLLAPPLAELLFGSLLIALTYLLGCELYDDTIARLGVALTLVAPNVVMFATSMDLPFAVFLLLAAWLFVRAARRGELESAGLSGIAMALAAFMTFSTLVLVACLSIWFASEWRAREGARRRLAAVAAVGALSCWVIFGGLLWVSGYDLPSAIAVQGAFDAKLMGSGVETFSRYLNLSVANGMAFWMGVGAPLVCLTARGVVRNWRRPGPIQDTMLLAVTLTVLLLAFSSLYSLEVERIWLFLTPLLALSAAKTLTESNEAREFGEALGLSCILLVLTEAVLRTEW